MSIDLSKPSVTRDWIYRFLPTVPVIAILAMLAAAGISWHRHKRQLDDAIVDFADSRSILRIDGVPTDVNQLGELDDRLTDQWLTILRASEGLIANYQRFSFVVDDNPSGQFVVPPGEAFLLEPIVDQYVSDARPIINALQPVVESNEPIWLPTIDEWMQTRYDELQHSRGISRMLLTEFVAAFHDGDKQRAMFALQAAGHLFAPKGQPRNFVIELVRQACLSGIISAASQSMQYDLWSDDELDQIEQFLLSENDLESRWRQTLQGEGQWMLQSFDDGDFLGANPVSESHLSIPVIAPSSRLRLMRQMQEIQSDTSDLGTMQHSKDVSQRALANRGIPFAADRWLGVPMLQDYSQAVWMLPSFEQLSTSMSRHHAKLNLARMSLAIRRYRRNQNEWPKSLSDLSSVGLPIAQTIDPFGNPMEFRQRDGDRFEIGFRKFPNPDRAEQFVGDTDPFVLHGGALFEPPMDAGEHR